MVSAFKLSKSQHRPSSITVNAKEDALGPRRPTRPELIPVSVEYCYSTLDGMLVHRRVTPQQYVAGTHLYSWMERDDVGQSILSKETAQWQGLGVEPPTFRSELQLANHYNTAPPL